MRRKTVVGLCGFAGSGKDTTADYLVEKHGFRKASFAAPIKDICRTVFDFTDAQIYGSLKEVPDERYIFAGNCVRCGSEMSCVLEPKVYWRCPSRKCGWTYAHKHITPRLAMQTLGTEWGRRLNSNTWVAATMNMIRSSDHDRWAISDVRFRNEIHAIQDHGGIVVRLLRGELRHDHPSETEMADMEDTEFDWTIDNRDSTIEELWGRIEAFLERYLNTPS